MSIEPIAIALEAGTYYLCSCGQSKNLPHCDGSHKGTYQPVVIEFESPQTIEISGLPEVQANREIAF